MHESRFDDIKILYSIIDSIVHIDVIIPYLRYDQLVQQLTLFCPTFELAMLFTSNAFPVFAETSKVLIVDLDSFRRRQRRVS